MRILSRRSVEVPFESSAESQQHKSHLHLTDERIRILYLEDNLADAELVMITIKDHWPKANLSHVSSREEFEAALESEEFEIVLSDYHVPGIFEREALHIAQRLKPSIPFIYVTGALGEKLAVQVLQDGATDYVLKDNLNKLKPSVNRAVQETRERQEKERIQHEKNELLEQLMRSEAKFRKLFEMAGVGIALVNRESFDILDANGRFEYLTGLPISELKGKQLSRFLFDDGELMRLKASVSAPDASSKAPEAVMATLRNSDGKLQYVQVTLVEEETVTTDGLILTFHDVTSHVEAEREIVYLNRSLEDKVERRTKELVRIQEDLRRSLDREQKLNQLRTKFVSMASHQFRTPLTVIKSNIDLLSTRKEDMDHELLQLFEKTYSRVDRQVEKMTLMMDEVLLLGKSQSQQDEIIVEDVDLSQVISDVAERHNETENGARNVEVRIEGTPRPIKMNRELVDHAFSNLVSNSLKYSKGKPSPSVELEFKTSTVEIRFIDHGIGIPEDEIEHITSPFFRASNTEAIKGTGLGMAIVREYLEKNGGRMFITSKINQGTTITVQF